MSLRSRSLLLSLALALTACAGQPAAAPTKGLPWATFMATSGHEVKGTVTPPPGARSAKVYLADADGSPVPGIFPSGADAQGRYAITGVPADFTVLVVAEITMDTGDRVLLKSLTHTTDDAVSVDISQATTIATEWALQANGGRLGGFDAEAFGQVVSKSYSLMAAGNTLPIRSMMDVVRELNKVAESDAALKAAMTTLKDELAKTQLGLKEAQEQITFLFEHVKLHKKALQDLADEQDKAKKHLKDLDDTTNGLKGKIKDELEPKLDELNGKHLALGHDLDALKALTGKELKDLEDKFDNAGKALDEHKKFTKEELEALKDSVGKFGDKVSDLEDKTNKKLKDVDDALQNGLSELKGMMGDLQSELHRQDNAHKDKEDSLKSQIDALDGALANLNGNFGQIKKQLDVFQVDVDNMKDLKNLVDTLNGKVTGQGNSVTALVDRVNDIQNRDHKTTLLTFGDTSTTSKNTFASLSGTSITFDAPTDGRMMVMFQGTTKNNSNGRNNQLRIVVDGNTGGEQTFGPTTADNLAGMGTMAIFAVTKGSHTIALEGMWTNNNGNANNNNSSATFNGKVFAMMLDDTSTPLPKP